MDKYLKPGAKLFQTEWGLDYRGRYSDLKSDLLKVQAAYVTRGHIIFLGEGCDVTYFFYTADYGSLDTPGEDGYGLCFNLNNARTVVRRYKGVSQAGFHECLHPDASAGRHPHSRAGRA